MSLDHPGRAKERDDAVNKVFGNPLNQSNLGGMLEERTLICTIGDPSGYLAFLTVEQKYNRLIRVGKSVNLKFPGHLDRVNGTIKRVSRIGAYSDELPEPITNMSSSPAIANARRDNGDEISNQKGVGDGNSATSTLLQVEVEFAAKKLDVTFGVTGNAMIQTGNRSLAWCIHNWINEIAQAKL